MLLLIEQPLCDFEFSASFVQGLIIDLRILCRTAPGSRKDPLQRAPNIGCIGQLGRPLLIRKCGHIERRLASDRGR